jgi:hypothetical protein
MKIANPTPAYCACCFTQKIGTRHIDFEAYFDGPVIDPGNGMKQTIDDLILCEDCVRTAAKFIGMVDNEEANEELAKLRAEVNQLRALRARNAQKLSRIEKALAPN